MIDLYGKSHCFVQFGQGDGPFQTVRAEIKTQPKGDDSIWRVRDFGRVVKGSNMMTPKRLGLYRLKAKPYVHRRNSDRRPIPG